MPKPLAGGYELLLAHQKLSGLGEDHRTLERMDSIGFQRQFQKDKELVEEAKSFMHRPERELKMNPALEKKSPVASTSSRSFRSKASRTS
ncbi:hypothetical protein O181_066833 [Austropuccinia psidii MF-1]|uniref:Uncharacterized protein n=1 Tax=Austropuccinia psidii MF-1 TaxID=1389203 RepID=A0A9Q3ES71_9BASI|nr:hypothetical protein [Austropuccinia psidii MF-1]